MSTQKVAKKILEAMKLIGYVRKDGKNKFQNYSYVGEANMVEQIRGAMIEVGLVAVPNVMSFEIAPAGQTKSGTPQFLTTILTKYTLIDTDSGESVDCTMLGQGHDSGDKGAYKAATGVNKYFLWKLFQIATGDDPQGGDPEGANDTSGPQGAHTARSGGSGDESWSLPSKYGTTDKPNLCNFCGEKHITKGVMLTKNQETGKYGAVDCLNADEPPKASPIFDRATVLTRISDGLMFLFPEDAEKRAAMILEHTGDTLAIKANEENLKKLFEAIRSAAKEKSPENV